MKRDTLGTLRARIAELEKERSSWQQLHSTLFAEKNQWFAEAAKQATRADEATRRAEDLDANCDHFVALAHQRFDEIAEWRQRAEVAEAALRALVYKLDAVHKDPQYEGVWMMHHVHGGRYTGLKYEVELHNARVVVEEQESTNAKH